MYEPEVSQLIRCLELLSDGLSPKASLESTLAYLHVCLRDELPLVELAEKMNWKSLKASRTISTLADNHYANGVHKSGYQVVYTEDDKNNRTLKNAYLTYKGKQMKTRLLDVLRVKLVKTV